MDLFLDWDSMDNSRCCWNVILSFCVNANELEWIGVDWDEHADHGDYKRIRVECC